MARCLLEPGLALQTVPPNTCPLFKLYLLGKQGLGQSLHLSSLLTPVTAFESFAQFQPNFTEV